MDPGKRENFETQSTSSKFVESGLSKILEEQEDPNDAGTLMTQLEIATEEKNLVIDEMKRISVVMDEIAAACQRYPNNQERAELRKQIVNIIKQSDLLK